MRTPLASISGNRRRHGELSPYERGFIAGQVAAGASKTSIASSLSCHRNTIDYTLQKSTSRENGESLPRSGQPKSYTERDERSILRIIRTNPKITLKKLKEEVEGDFSRWTLARIFDKYNIKKWMAAKRLMLKKEHAKLRLQWAKDRIDWDEDEWSVVIWSDECSVERGSGRQRQWVFRTPQQKWDSDMIQEYKKGKDMKIMVWAAFSGKTGRSKLVIMSRDQEAKRQGYSANSYIKVLDEMMPDVYDGGMIFMQDNAPIHTANKVKRWLDNNGIWVMQWPPYSPDLNPIENLWFKLKETVFLVDPGLEHDTSFEDTSRRRMEQALIKAWDLIPQSYFDSCWKSMPRRVQAVKDAHGWHTKY